MKYVREIEIGSELCDTVIRKVERGETITFTNGANNFEVGIFKILSAKCGRAGFVDVKMERVNNVGFTL